MSMICSSCSELQDARHQCHCTFSQIGLLSGIHMLLHIFVWPYHLQVSLGHYRLLHHITIRTTNILKFEVDVIVQRLYWQTSMIRFLLRFIWKKETICCLFCQTLLLNVSQASEVKWSEAGETETEWDKSAYCLCWQCQLLGDNM